MTLTWIVLATIAGGALSVCAAAFALVLRAAWVPTLVSFAIGTLLGAAFLEVIPHAFEQGEAHLTAGAILGGIAGSAAENKINERRGLEITVRLDNGEMRAITQEADEVFRPGERVRLLSSGGVTRVTH